MKGRIYDPLAARFTTADPVMQAPFWSQGLNRYSYAFNNPVNNTDPSGFTVDGEDSTLGIMGWGGFTVGAAALSSSSFGAIAGGTGIGGLNVATSLLTDQYSLFDGSAGSVSHGAAPTTAPKGTGVNRGAGGGAAGQNKGSVGPTYGGAAAPCGEGNNPRCGDPMTRAKHIAEQGSVLGDIDDLVKGWANQPSTVDPSGKQTIRQATTAADPRRRVEQTAGIIVDANGRARLTRTFHGDLDSSQVDWDKVTLRDGDMIVGTVHSHPGGPGSEHFSQGDIRTGKQFFKEAREQHALYSGVGAHLYVVQPGADGGVLDYNIARNVITVVR